LGLQNRVIVDPSYARWNGAANQVELLTGERYLVTCYATWGSRQQLRYIGCVLPNNSVRQISQTYSPIQDNTQLNITCVVDLRNDQAGQWFQCILEQATTQTGSIRALTATIARVP